MWSYFELTQCVCFHAMGRGYGITPPAYWLLAAWHWSETGKPAYRGRYEYAKAWLLFMIKAYLIWKWEQARWLKEHWVVGQKREERKKRWRGERRGERQHTSSEVWKLGWVICETEKDLTSLGMVRIAISTTCSHHQTTVSHSRC